MDPLERAHHGRGLRAAPAAVQPREVRREALGRDREERGHEVHRHHLEAPRRLLPVGFGAHRVGCRRLAVRAARSAQGTRGCVRRSGHPPVLLPLDHGLAPPRLPPAPRVGHALGRGRRLRSLRGVHEGAAQGARHGPLRQGRHPLVRRRMGRHLDAREGQGALRLCARPRPRHHREQPRRHGPLGHGRHHARRRLPRRLRHARAADPRNGSRPRRRLGNLHDHERHLGLQEERRQLEVGDGSRPQAR